MKTLAVILALTTTVAWAEMPLPTVVHTDNGSVLVIPNYTTGQTQAIISTSGSSDKNTINTQISTPLVKSQQKQGGK